MTRDKRNRKKTRVAVISLHTSPKDPPGGGDSGGMNVYIMSVARRLAAQGVKVDIYTRCSGRQVPEVDAIASGGRLIQVPAGPCAPVPKERLPELLPSFLGGVLSRAAQDNHGHSHPPYDVVHSHYWLSGWIGRHAKEIWGAPLVASFHTLGKVKNISLDNGETPEPVERLAGEERVIRGADRILAPTLAEASQLVGLYGAERSRIDVIPPGVDHSIFIPRPKQRAREQLGFGGRRLLLFVGRLQSLKGPDVAIRAFAAAVDRDPQATADTVLLVVGGVSGGQPEQALRRLREEAASARVAERVVFYPPQPHERLADFYSAAEALLVPSRTESFGLVALEAQACGTPVIGTASAGLTHVVRDGVTGLLVDGRDPEQYADRILCLLGDPALLARLSSAAAAHAGCFSWEDTTARIRRVYSELLDGRDR